MKPPLRIAVLECDIPQPKAKAEYGSYGAVHEKLIRRAMPAVGLSEEDVEIKYYDVQAEGSTYPKLEDIDAIWMTGSKFNAYDNDSWILTLIEYVKKVLAQTRVKAVGICFGHQILGRALGGKVCKSNQGWEVSVLPMSLSQTGKKLFKTENLSIYQMHTDIIDGFPEGVEPLASTDRCQNQGMYAKGRLISVQGHPEFTCQIVDEVLNVRHDSGVFSNEVFEDGMKRLTKHDDGVEIGQGILRFLLEA